MSRCRNRARDRFACACCCSPVNPSDFQYVRGTYYQALERIIWNQRRSDADRRVCFDPDRTVECPVPPYALGGEGVGVVDAGGGGFLANHLKGKRVAVAGGPPNGTWQEFTVVDAKRAVVVPDEPCRRAGGHVPDQSDLGPRNGP